MFNVFDSRILVIGSGGLGCELLKSLVLNGFKNISIVDFDKVVISNLNRQFIFGYFYKFKIFLKFRIDDINKYKSQVAFEYIKHWNGSDTSDFYISKIEDISLDILSNFDLIFSALDSINSRRWLNSAFFEISKDNKYRIFIDGGSQNLYGHVRVIKPGTTSCIECSLSLFSSEDPLPCTLTNNLKTPEECIYYSIYFDWELSNKLSEELPPETFINHIYQSSKNLAKTKNIKGVSIDLVDKMCNKYIPNISTTNSIIASLMVNTILNMDSINDFNYYFYTGDGLTNLSKFNLEPNENCIICQSKYVTLEVTNNITLNELISTLSKEINSDSLNISSDKGILYFNSPKCIRDLYQYRLNMKLRYFNKTNKLILVNSIVYYLTNYMSQIL